jgi:hypothetical protein
MRLHKALCTAALAASAVLLTAVPALAVDTPLETGCPAGYERMTVAELEATGHIPAPARVDAAGNANGSVCARPFADAANEQLCRLAPGGPCAVEQIYLYLDDNLTP